MNCKYCNKELSPKGKSHELFCKANPERKSRSGSNNPNYGKKGSNQYKKGRTMSEATKAKIGKAHKGKTLTDDHKSKISASRKLFLDENPGKIPYLLNHSSKESYPEKIFREALERNNIKGWEYNYSILRYAIDFAFTDHKLAVEIDGGTHLLQEVVEKDKIRDKRLSDLGWNTIRFTASDVKTDVEKCIEILKTQLITGFEPQPSH